MRILAIALGLTLAAVFVAAFAAAQPEPAPTQETPLKPAPEVIQPPAEPGGLQLAAAVAALSALFIVAPLTRGL
jgi:hypothetical protein